MNLRHFFFLSVLFIVSYATRANNINVANVGISGQNEALDFKLIDFDISWDNSWYINGASNNHDAAWVFVKYRLKTETTWHHATLHYVDGTGTADGHTEPANSNIISSNDNAAGGAHGVFIHRTNLGQGPLTLTGVKLRWDYGVDDLGDGDNVELCVMAIEMVYVRQGSFYVGSGGTEAGAFYTYPTTTNPYQITSEAAITVGTTDGNLLYPYSPFGESGDQSGPIPSTFPKGYNDFYCMKYEITQSQYVAFLNKLTYTQQATRTAVAPNSTPGTAAMTTGTLYRNGIDIMTSGVASTTPAVYACNLDNDALYEEAVDGQSIACNWLSWEDVAAYLDWVALRPMTELEYEKAGRGNRVPVQDEYAWGTTSATNATSISNSGENNEIAQTGSNCTYASGVLGPMRSGNFAQAATTRSQAGASYYGIMELSGNLSERAVTVGHPFGRSYTGVAGNGRLNVSGDADASSWPDLQGLGIGLRGGAWNESANWLRLSDRTFAADPLGGRTALYGGRGCRLAP